MTVSFNSAKESEIFCSCKDKSLTDWIEVAEDSIPAEICLSVITICSKEIVCCSIKPLISFAEDTVTSEEFFILLNLSSSFTESWNPSLIFFVPPSEAKINESEECCISEILC